MSYLYGGDWLFEECHVDTTNIKYRVGVYLNRGDTICLTGLKQGYLWFAYFKGDNQGLNISKLDEWIDTEKLPLGLSYSGFGEYEYSLYGILTDQYFKLQNTSFISLVIYYNATNKYGSSKVLTRNIILSNGNVKLNKNGGYRFNKWYGNTVLLTGSNVLYSETGDSICKLYDSFPSLSDDWCSIKESIKVSLNSGIQFSKYDYSKPKTATVWSSNVPYTFEIPKDEKIKLSSYEIKKKDDIWDYTLHFIFYDGTKKDMSVRVDVNSGKVQAL